MCEASIGFVLYWPHVLISLAIYSVWRKSLIKLATDCLSWLGQATEKKPSNMNANTAAILGLGQPRHVNAVVVNGVWERLGNFKDRQELHDGTVHTDRENQEH